MDLRRVPALSGLVAAYDRIAQQLPGPRIVRQGMTELRDALERAVQGQHAVVETLRGEIAALRAAQRRDLARLVQDIGSIGTGLATVQHRVAIAGAGPVEPGEAHVAALHALGMLNYENPIVSGERHFLHHYFEQAPAALVLDVGANTGQFAALAREVAPHATIHCFEPHPRAFAQLSAQATTLGVTAHALALGDTDGELEFYDYADDPGSQHASLYREVIEGIHHGKASAITVRCETLDAVAARLGIARIGLLKIDTEGHELAVLKGARGLLDAGAIDVIQFEFNEMNVISRVFMKDFFDLLPGFRLFRLLPAGAIALASYDPRAMEIFAYQNIACIRRDLDPAWLGAG